MRTNIACSAAGLAGGVTPSGCVVYAFCTLNSYSNTVIASQFHHFIIKNYGDSYSSPISQFVNTS